jgi:glutamate/tyrosine decarboxylase-like PLP-dependent enzyme
MAQDATARRTGNEAALDRAAGHALAFLAGLPGRPVHARATHAELLAARGGSLPDHASDPADVIDDLVAAADPGLVASAGPHYYGYVIGGAVPAALAADWLTSAWDQNAGAYSPSPAASVAEEVAGAWLVDVLGLPAGSGVGFTTGCQAAHVTCLAAARHAVLARRGWDVEEQGLFGAPAIDVIIGADAHATIPTALQYLGLGRSRVIRAAADGQGRITLGALASVLPEGDGPLVICLQAGNVNTGAFDPLAGAIALIRERRADAWVHVDGAFGLWAAAVPRLRPLLDGYEQADSWATDGHKWLNVPYDAGYAFVRDPAMQAAAMAPSHGAYIEYGTVERDEFLWVLEYSRRARGFATWAALRSLGRAGVEEQIDRGCRMAERMADRLRGAAGVEILNDVVLNQVLVRFPTPDGDPAGGDLRTRGVIRAVQEEGAIWLGGTTWQGRAAMRISVANWATGTAEADRAADAILRAAAVAPASR